jgi:small subunit ribosomal protein S10e
MVLISRKNRRDLYTQLFNDGVMAVEKNSAKKFHQDVKDCANLVAMMALKSLASRGLVAEKFSWGWHYYTLNDEGIVYLREFLALPASALPNTQTKTETSGEKEARPERASKWGRDQE